MTAKKAIIYSAHIGTKRENIGDVLSAKAIKILINKNNIRLFDLPRKIGLSNNLKAIYGGGGMIRPSFVEREYIDFIQRKNKPYCIYGIGLNIDKGGKKFNKKSLEALKKWILEAKKITVRERYSLDFVYKKFGIKPNLSPCPTYTILKTKKIKSDIKIKYNIGIVPSFGHTIIYKKYKKEAIKLIKELIKKLENLCIICHDAQDYEISKRLFKNKKVKIIFPKSFHSVYRAYKSCESIITMRGHGVIFAAATEKKCSHIPINQKLNYLYNYHYGGKFKNINFNLNYHLKNIEKNEKPINFKGDSKLKYE